MSDMHFLILGMRSGKTACGLRVHCFYPSREEAEIKGPGETLIRCAPCTPIAFRVTCKECRRVWDAKADIRKTSELDADGGEESSPRMANNMAMTPEDKAELARLDAEQVEDDAEVIQIAVERTQHAQQGVGWQERNVQWLESASNRIEELKRRRTARNAARERILMRVSDGAVVVNDGSSGMPN